MEGDVAPLPEIVELCRSFGARLMVDEAHALGVLGARGAGTAELFGVEDRGRPADGHLLEVAGLLRRRDRGPGGRDRVPADPVAAVHVHRVGGAGSHRRGARRGPHLPLGRGRELFAKVLDNARYLHRGLSELGFQVVEPTRLADGTEVVTPVVPVVVGDDWKAVFLWKALYEAGVYVNVAIHPAVPPAGALLRTSVMATHDHDTLDLALERFATVQAGVRGRARTAPGPVLIGRSAQPSLVQFRTSPWREKKCALSACSARCDVAVTPPVQ